jgi:hypothetical protein
MFRFKEYIDLKNLFSTLKYLASSKTMVNFGMNELWIRKIVY